MIAVSDAAEADKQKWIAARLVELVCARTPVALALNIVNAAIMVFVLRDAVPAALRFVWFGCLVAVTLARALLWQRHNAAGPAPDQAALWGARFAVGAGAGGVLWGAAALLFFVPGAPALQAYVAIAVGVMAAGAVVALGAHPPAFYAFCIPAIVALAGRFLFQGGEVSIVIGILIAAFGAVLLVAAEALHRNHARVLALRLENMDLVGSVSAANEAARSGDLAKAAFLGSISHELRTPLNAIIGFSEILKDELFGELGQPQYRDYAGLIHDSAEHLLDVINEILDISDAESGRLKLDEETVDVARLVAVCVDLVAARAGARGAPIAVRIAPDLPNLRADARRLRQILLNLLSNALKFTAQGGRIEVRAATDAQGRLALAVSDTGVGMSAEDAARATQPFARGDARLSRGAGGTGIGLPLSKALVELHGGSLMLESELGAGTTVTARFPRERVSARGGPSGPA